MFVSSTQVSKEGKVGKAQYNDVSDLLKLVSTKVGIILPEGRFQGGENYLRKFIYSDFTILLLAISLSFYRQIIFYCLHKVYRRKYYARQ